MVLIQNELLSQGSNAGEFSSAPTWYAIRAAHDTSPFRQWPPGAEITVRPPWSARTPRGQVHQGLARQAASGFSSEAGRRSHVSKAVDCGAGVLG